MCVYCIPTLLLSEWYGRVRKGKKRRERRALHLWLKVEGFVYLHVFEFKENDLPWLCFVKQMFKEGGESVVQIT